MHKPTEALDFALRETSPNIGAGAVMRDKLSCTYDLVEKKHYLYVRVVRAKDFPQTGGGIPHVQPGGKKRGGEVTVDSGVVLTKGCSTVAAAA